MVFDAYGAMRNCPIPIIAVVQGGAHGFGCAIAAACDITLASDKATFSVPEMAHQIMPTMVLSSFVDRVPKKAAAYLAYSMFEVSAERALSYGIVSDVFPAAQLDAQVDKLTTAMLKAPRISLTSAKEYISTAPDMPLAARCQSRHLNRPRNQETAIMGVIAGLDPAIQLLEEMDGRVKPGHDAETRPEIQEPMKVFIFDLLALRQALRSIQSVQVSALSAAARSLRSRGRGADL